MRVYLAIRLLEPKHEDLPYQLAISLSPTSLIPDDSRDADLDTDDEVAAGHQLWEQGLLVGRASLIEHAMTRRERLRVPKAKTYKGNAHLENEGSVMVQPVIVDGEAAAVVGLSAQSELLAADNNSLDLAKELALMISTVLKRAIATAPPESSAAGVMAEVFAYLEQNEKHAVGVADEER
jgi:hypothetical protein